MPPFGKIGKIIISLVCLAIPTYLILMYFLSDDFLFLINCLFFIPAESFFLWLLLNYNKLQNNINENE